MRFFVGLFRNPVASKTPIFRDAGACAHSAAQDATRRVATTDNMRFMKLLSPDRLSIKNYVRSRM
jgi:hypothetical protein